MLRILILLSLLFVLVASLSVETLGFDQKQTSVKDYEDYGCVHEDHSQFEDGDGLNIKMLNSTRW